LYPDSLDFESDKLVGFFSEFICGFTLKSYKFNKYKTLNKKEIDKKINFKIVTSNRSKIEKKYKYYDAIREGVFLTRDLVSEPPNILNPKAYVSEIKKLSKLGLNIKIYNEKEMKKLGLNALLGVGQGSVNES
jgi:leucyl aminopeptidase